MTAHRLALVDGPRTVWTVEVGPPGSTAADVAICFDGQVWATTMPIAASLGALGPRLTRRLVVTLVDSVDVPTRAAT